MNSAQALSAEVLYTRHGGWWGLHVPAAWMGACLVFTQSLATEQVSIL